MRRCRSAPNRMPCYGVVRHLGAKIMNWGAIGALAELLGAIAVIGTLLYLRLQIKQQNKSQQLEVKESILEGFNRANEQLASDPTLASLFVRGLNDPDALSISESAQFSWLLRLFVNQYVKIFDLYQNGTLTEDEWRDFGAQGAFMMTRPGGQRWLEGHGGTFQYFYDELFKLPFDETVIDFTMGRPWTEYGSDDA